MHVGVVGLNHRLADLKLRELLAKICQRRFGPGCSVHADHEFVLLSTCNRTEIYFTSWDLTETHKYILSILRGDIECDFEQKLYSFFDEDCFQHLARVTGGLDSAIVFETEIQGQVKAAYERACQYHSLSHHLHFLFQKCLRIGKKVRSSVPLERGIPDVEHAILNTGRHFFDSIAEREVLFIGASDINLKILHFLKNKDIENITLCNRTDYTAHQVAEKYGLQTLSWGKLDRWKYYDWVIFGTKSPEYLITINSMEAFQSSQKLVIDLCVPRNVDPLLGKHPQVTLLNIDQINRMLKMRKKQIQSILAYAEDVVNESSDRHATIFRKRMTARASLQKVEA